MAYPQFEDLKVWQKARELSVATSTVLVSCVDDRIKEQLQRDSLTILNNIAKGYERKGSHEFDRFLYIARGYCGEYKSTLYVAEDLQCITPEQRLALYETCTDIAKMLSGLIKHLKEDHTSHAPEVKVVEASASAA